MYARPGAFLPTPPVHGALERPIDLHAHTVVSDGTLTPTQLVERAAAAGLAALALTDHDHVGGLAEARRLAPRLGLEIVAGIELSASRGGKDVHVLGYLFDEHDAAFLGRLEALREARERRGVLILDKLRSLGIDIAPEDLARELGDHGGAVGRPHVARALMRRGVVASVQEAFDLYLAEGRPAFVEKEKLDVAEAIALVHAAGGLAVLAHPGLFDAATREALVREAARAGLDGVEVEHPKNGPDARASLRALAAELRLVETGGSDFHGENKPDVELGRGIAGNVRVTMATLDALKRALAARRGRPS
jgi:predicted metal-dependent phosphoesterase TrpH